MSKDNNDPYILATGSSANSITSMVIVAGKTVISEKIGSQILSGILVLLAVHYVYNWQFNTQSKEVMEFLQEKLLLDPLPKKPTVAYSNLYRAIGLIESKLPNQDDSQDTEDEDSTQPIWDIV